MVTKSKKTDKRETGRGKVKVGKLKLNLETVKDLTGGQQKRIKGGFVVKEVPNPPPITPLFGSCATGRQNCCALTQ